MVIRVGGSHGRNYNDENNARAEFENRAPGWRVDCRYRSRSLRICAANKTIDRVSLSAFGDTNLAGDSRGKILLHLSKHGQQDDLPEDWNKSYVEL